MFSQNTFAPETAMLEESDLVSLVVNGYCYKPVTLSLDNITQPDGSQITFTASVLPATVGDMDSRLSFTLRLSRESASQG